MCGYTVTLIFSRSKESFGPLILFKGTQQTEPSLEVKQDALQWAVQQGRGTPVPVQ